MIGYNETMKATKIQWDTDGDNSVKLPSEVEIPDEIAREDDEDAISDYLSDLTGYCHYGFELEK